MINYKDAKHIRFSCAYLFRICINGKYFLVRDEQGRGTFQPVGGVYKYIDKTILHKFNATQCMRFGANTDLDYDIRLIVPRSSANKFNRWYNQEKGRENQTNLYREFKEEVLDRIDLIDSKVFEEIKYRCCGTITEADRMNENDMQIRIADIVELIPTPEQSKAFQTLIEHESDVYRFATKEEIYELGRIGGNQIQTISPHTKKVLKEEEKYLKKNKHSGKYYKIKSEEPTDNSAESWPLIEKANTSEDFTFISYNTSNGKSVWTFCNDNAPPLNNIWIDRKNVSENWEEDVIKALNMPTCKKAILFINKDYLIRSGPCYKEAKIILENKIPHIIVLVDTDISYVLTIINDWIHNNIPEKERLILYKSLFGYDDNSAQFNASIFNLNVSSKERLLQAYNNL